MYDVKSLISKDQKGVIDRQQYSTDIKEIDSQLISIGQSNQPLKKI